jgi:hypothetical protein
VSHPLDALRLAAFDAEPSGGWPEAVPTTPLPEQERIVEATLKKCAGTGLRVPPHEVTWLFGERLRRGRTILWDDGRLTMWLNVRLVPDELRAVVCHEAKHLEDYHAGLYRTLSRGELEQRAVDFANTMLARTAGMR